MKTTFLFKVVSFKKISVVFIFLFITFFTKAFSATITTTGNGNWSSTVPGSPWPNGIIPLATDDIIIGNNFTLTVDGNRTSNSISFSAPSNGSGSGTLSVNAGIQLTVTTVVSAPASGTSVKVSGTYNISGMGTIISSSLDCNNTTAPSGNSSTTILLVSTVNSLNISGNLNLNATVSGTKLNNPTFNLQSGTVTVNGSLTSVNAGAGSISTLDMVTPSSNPALVNPTLVLGSATPFNLSATGTNTTNFNGTGATVNYSYSGDQTVRAATYTNLTLSGSGNKTTTGTTVNGTLSIQGTAAAITTSPVYGASAILEYKGSAAQTTTNIEFPLTGGPNSVTINNTNGVTINGNKTINSTLTFTNGRLFTGTNKISLGASAITSGASATKYISGNEEIFIPNAASPSKTFDIGSPTNYTPVTITFTGTTTGSGSLTAFATSGDDADIANSGINSSRSVNRTWTITNNTVSGFSSYNGTFNFVTTDIDAGAATSNFMARKLFASSWATTNLIAANSLSTSAGGTTSFGKFQIGEANTILVTTDPANTSVCAGNSTSFTSISASTPAPTVKWQRDPNTGIFADITSTMDGGVYTNFTSTTLNISNVTGLNNYKYRTIFTNINGTTTSASANLTVTPIPNATISYAATPYCSNSGTATVTRTGTVGGTYSSTSGLTINPTSGDVTLATSTPGTYTVTYTIAASGGCSAYTTTTTITITAAPNASISYGSSPYCSNAGTASVTLTGTTGGTYSSAAGLSINTTTGAVNLSASTPGTYTVIYTVAASGGCAAYSTTAPITISAAPSATISYAGSPYCSNAGTASVTFTGTTGGTYSSITGLSINTTTGAVNLSASTPGTYTVTYTVAASGGCAAYTTTASITITAAPSATISYAGSPYCSNAGTASVTLTGTSGGTYSSAAGLSINATTGAVNLSASTPGTYTVTYTVAASGGCAAYSITAPITITAAPFATISYAGSPYCSNAGTASVTLTGTTGGTYSSASGLSINGTTGAVNLSASTPGTYTVTYTVAASGGCAAYSITAPITIIAAGTWTGVVNNDWNNAGNWSCGSVPTSTTDVTIQGNASAFPVINSGMIAIRNLTIQPGASLTISTAILQISGTIANSGTLTATNATIEMNGTAAQTIAANTFAANTIKDLIITNAAGVSLAGTLNIPSTVLFGNINNSTFTTGGFLTLVSNAAGTARVADITNGGTNTGNNINGNVTVQRYISAKRAFRFLTAPVNSTGSIRANWMENTNNSSTSVNNNPVPNFGTHITGSGGNTNGFDQTNTNNPSLFTFNNVTQAWVAATNTSSLLTAGSAYSIMVRGSRSTDLNSNIPTPSPTTLRATGILASGTLVLKAAGAGGTPGMPALSAVTNAYSFIANPYASPVDWFLIETNDISPTIYIFDPTVSGSKGRGGYIAFNRSIGDAGGSNNASSNVDNNIQSGQAFFVKTTGAIPNPTLTFRENYKTGINKAVFRNPSVMPKLSLQLLLPGQESTGGSADGLAAYFSNDFDSSIGDEDSYKFTNEDENIAILRNGRTLSIEGRKPVNTNDTLPIKIWNLTQTNYTFKVNLSNFDEGIESFLEDSYLHTSTMLTNNDETMIPFSITADTASVATDRFRIVFKNSVTLALPFLSIKAYEKNNGVEVKWTAAEKNTDRYEVEKSVDAQVFVVAGSIKANVNDNTSGYSWFDTDPANGDNFYRIKSVSNSGEIKYSTVVKVTLKALDKSITVYPNPVKGNSINLFLRNINKGNYSVSLINSSGQTIYKGTVSHTGGSTRQVIKLLHIMAKGSYQLQMFSDVSIKSISILVQ